MLVKNFYAAFAQHLFGTTSEAITSTSGSTMKLSGLSATYTPFFGTESYCARLDQVPTSSTRGVFFGNGTSTSFDQTALPKTLYNFQSGFSASASSIERSVSTESAFVTANYTITNNSDTDFVISSISACATANGSASGQYLVDHTILDAPITIPAGGVGQVTYTIHFNYPTA